MKSVFSIFEKRCKEQKTSIAAKYKSHGVWKNLSWQDLQAKSLSISAYLQKIGISRGDKIAILSNTCLQWSLADLGTIAIGACAVPIYHNSTESDIEYIINDSGAKIIFVQDLVQINKIRSLIKLKKLVNVQKIICFEDDTIDENNDAEASLSLVMQDGAALLAKNRSKIDEAKKLVDEGDILTIVYTSGTTGQPKGVVITHKNMIYEAEKIDDLHMLTSSDIQLIFLPLAHIFAKVLQIVWFNTGHIMAFAESIEKLADNMLEVKPTVMAGVPRIYEKIYGKIIDSAKQSRGIKKRLVNMALCEFSHAVKLAKKGVDYHSWRWDLSEKLVFNKIAKELQQKFGGKLRYFFSGGAALSFNIGYFFMVAGVKIYEGYGLTETSAATFLNRPNKVKMGSVGQVIDGTKAIIADDGEILIKGPGVFTGYYNDAKSTNEAFDEKGWFRTGDLGYLDEDGYLHITDRKKDIIITSQGKNIAPQKIENAIKSENSLISHVVIVGDDQPFIAALIALDEVSLTMWAGKKGFKIPYAELLTHDEVRAEIEQAINNVNKYLPSFEGVKKFIIADKDFEIGKELTPTMKVKRKYCTKKYEKVLSQLYS